MEPSSIAGSRGTQKCRRGKVVVLEQADPSSLLTDGTGFNTGPVVASPELAALQEHGRNWEKFSALMFDI